MFASSEPERKECGNCGSTFGLLRCSRCHSAFFCSAKCQKAHWPFHKDVCKRNEFADMIEESDHKFSSWLRTHGKQAVLKDDEVDRIERAAAATCDTRSREEVLDSMYGRLDPKPIGSTYSLDERKRMAAREDNEMLQDRQLTPEQRIWRQIELQPELGKDCGSYKWRQNQSHVEVFVRLPAYAKPHQVTVHISSKHMAVHADGNRVAGGELLRSVVPYDSMWQMQDGIVEVSLLKASRRGRYAPGTTNADTFWDRVWLQGLQQDALPSPAAPLAYYNSAYEADDAEQLQLSTAAHQQDVGQPMRHQRKALTAA